MDKYDKARPAQEELKPSVEKLRELSSHLQIALEAERTRIAREIHDELGSTLAIFQETLTNITCHAGATRVTVKAQVCADGVMITRYGRPSAGRLRVKAQTCADGVMITVSDNGKGIVPADMVNGKSWGIVGMRERAKYFGGDLNIAGAPGHGTTVILRMPLEKKHE